MKTLLIWSCRKRVSNFLPKIHRRHYVIDMKEKETNENKDKLIKVAILKN